MGKLTEEDVGDVHTEPAKEPTDSRQVDEPVEDGHRTARRVHKRQEAKQAGDDHGRDGQTVLRAVGEDPRGLSTEGETVEDTGRREQERVAGGEGRREDARVDDVRENGDASASHGDDIRRGCSGSSARHEVGIVVWDEHAGDENTSHLFRKFSA